MIEESDLETNVLEFRRKSFAFERSVELDGERLAVFLRTETESESQFRPRILRLRVAIPTAWIELSDDEGALRIAPPGRAPTRRPPGEAPEALEAAAEATRFEEGGVAWQRHPVSPGGFLYVPEALAGRLLSRSGLAGLGFP
ncbi:MAG TPA: hypothetical protein VGX00_02745 [Thermoplasmata archaeon]|nr:hypothetical protein [Thermoplasmata archaeon]